MNSRKRVIWTWIIAVFFVGAGSNHFLSPTPYLAMMPSYLPWHSLLVWISGIAEICGGIGILLRPVKVVAGWGLIALLVAVFPANLNVALNGWPGVSLPMWSLWARLPLQIVMIWAVYFLVIADAAEVETRASYSKKA